MSTMKRSITVLVATGLLLSACGGTSEDAADADQSSAPDTIDAIQVESAQAECRS